MERTPSSAAGGLNGRRISDILATLPDRFPSSHTTVGALLEALAGRAYGILLLVLALPNLIPVPAPGLSALLGLPLLWVTFQQVLGLETPWLPGGVARRRIKTSHLRSVCSRMVPAMRKLEYVMTPRLMLLTSPPAVRLIALLCVILSLMIAMPIPFGNAFPALAICLFAIGILQRDGLFVLLGLTVALLSATVIAAFLMGLLLSASAFFGL
ncbi:MAG: exopolysaccharide biosynthesis protein [Alphaproteobacteria bacterium]|nr:exopolysaccharide biosynthesis protein [Alphaproteobacteria bacterium]